MFPQLTLQPAFCWAGTFAETGDGLPFFGAHAQHGPRVQFAMAYGGNGITYAAIGAHPAHAAAAQAPSVTCRPCSASNACRAVEPQPPAPSVSRTVACGGGAC